MFVYINSFKYLFLLSENKESYSYKSCTVFIRSFPSLFELNYMLFQDNCINNGETNGLI